MSGTSSRMLTLLSLLHSRRDWPGHVLADRLDVTPRTVRRDIDRLRDLGYAITAAKGPDGGYRLAAGSELPPLLFGDGEIKQVSDTMSRVRIGSWSWAGLTSWILRFDVPFTILGPDAFIDSMSRFTHRLTAAQPDPAGRRKGSASE